MRLDEWIEYRDRQHRKHQRHEDIGTALSTMVIWFTIIVALLFAALS
jgi:hypothetical protein